MDFLGDRRAHNFPISLEKTVCESIRALSFIMMNDKCSFFDLSYRWFLYESFIYLLSATYYARNCFTPINVEILPIRSNFHFSRLLHSLLKQKEIYTKYYSWLHESNFISLSFTPFFFFHFFLFPPTSTYYIPLIYSTNNQSHS